MKSPRMSMKLPFVIALSMFSALYSPAWFAAKAQLLQFNMPSPPSKGTPLGRSSGGASRGTCPAVNVPLTPLATFTPQSIASRQKAEVDYWGLTTSQHPTLWFYMPYQGWANYPAKFVLQDEQDNTIYQSKIPLPAQPGIISVSLAGAPALETGKSYHWFFKVYCQKEEADTPALVIDSPVSVEGMIHRVSLSSAVAKQIETASPKQKINIYAQNGIWFDAFNVLANLRLANPSDQSLNAEWTSLLQSVALEDVAPAPLIKCCQPGRSSGNL